MPSLEVHGAALDFDVVDGPGRTGPAVVQLHGLTSSRRRDQVLGVDVTRTLRATPGARVLRYDARGHGASAGTLVPDDYRWHRLAEDLLTLLDHVFPGEQVHGCGPSMGTGTLLHAAVRAPRRFASLSLVVPPTAWETRRARSAVYVDQAGLVERDGIEAFITAAEAEAERPPPATAQVPSTRPAVAADLLPTVLRGAALADLPPREQLAGIDVPCLVLAWTDDPTHPLSTAHALCSLLAGASLAVAHTPTDLAAWPARVARHVAGWHETAVLQPRP